MIDWTWFGDHVVTMVTSGSIVGLAVLKYTRRSAAAEAVQKENEAKSIEMQVTEKIQSIYDKALDDMRQEFERRLQAQQTTIDAQTKVIRRQDEKLEQQSRRISEQDGLIIELRKEISQNNDKINSMRPLLCTKNCAERCNTFAAL